MPVIDELLEHAREREGPPPADPDAPAPRRQVAVVVCMDARIDPAALLGLQPGDAHVIRNAGGVVTDDVIRSLALSQRKLGTREVMVVQHTRCGVQTVTEDGFKDELEADTGVRPTWSVEAFRDLEASVRRSLARLQASPFLVHKDGVRGFVYAVEDGSLREVAR